MQCFSMHFKQLAISAWLCAATASAGIVAYYPFTGNANDASGNGHDGIVFGATLTADRFGNPNSAYYFGGTDYIACPPGVYFSGDFTVSGWVHLPSYRLWSRLLDFSNNGLVADPYAINPHVTLTLSKEYTGLPRGDVTGNPNSVLSTIVIPLDEWVQVTWTLFGQSTVLYVNGAQVSQETWTTPPPAVVRTDNWIGRSNWENTPTHDQRTLGSMDDIRIYDHALSASEVFQLYTMESVPEPSCPLLLGVVLTIGLASRRDREDKHRRRSPALF